MASAHVQKLLGRLDAIGRSLADTGQGLALLGLGSVGVERDRLDDYSDLDFFAIVAPGSGQRFLSTLDWLTDIHPVVFHFRNTHDGYKLLYADGVFCEFAVFEPAQLAGIPFAAGKVVWQADGFDPALLTPAPPRTPDPLTHSVDFHLGEALSNLYVGLGRERRGERLSAFKFIQEYALDHALELAHLAETPTAAHADPFSVSRRFEARYPETAAQLAAFAQGYAYNRESARAILGWLDAHFEVNAGMKARILALSEG
ncbi:MAG: hypothetical protein IPK19_26775 [Chloroflexi bacterium]|nr:hypothetical protein [Chloroflexota bacterium]